MELINKLEGEFYDVAAVWAKYPEGGIEGDYVEIGGDIYGWNKYEKQWRRYDGSDRPHPGEVRSVEVDKGDRHIFGDLHVGGKFHGNIRQPNCGLFQTQEDLKARYPHPYAGQWAVVGNTIPGEMFVCATEGVWTATGYNGGTDGIDLDWYNKAINMLTRTKQDINDDSLETIAKTIIGAINELKNTKTEFDKNTGKLDKTQAPAFAFTRFYDSNNPLHAKPTPGETYYDVVTKTIITATTSIETADIVEIPQKEFIYLCTTEGELYQRKGTDMVLLLENKQEKHDDSLKTESKDISGAINEIFSLKPGKRTEQGGELFNTIAENHAGINAHAEGEGTKANAKNSHTHGYHTIADGECATAEGFACRAIGGASHAEGYLTITSNSGEHAQGRLNKSNSDTISSIGIGENTSSRKNAVEVMRDGRMFLLGVGSYDGTNPEKSVSLQNVFQSVFDEFKQTQKKIVINHYPPIEGDYMDVLTALESGAQLIFKSLDGEIFLPSAAQINNSFKDSTLEVHKDLFLAFLTEPGVNLYTWQSEEVMPGCYSRVFHSLTPALQHKLTAGENIKISGDMISSPVPKGGYMRKLCEKVGATFNEHSGYYEMNGLTDITENQMAAIYNASYVSKEIDLTNAGAFMEVRTLPTFTNACRYSGWFGSTKTSGLLRYSDIEVVSLSDLYLGSVDSYMFSNCPKLHTIKGILNAYSTTATFKGFLAGSNNIKNFKIKKLQKNVEFSTQLKITYDTFKYMVDNATNKNVITIKVHPTTMTYFDGTATAPAEVGGTKEEWATLLQTAKDKQITIMA